VVPAEGAPAPDEQALRAYLRERVAPYKAPRRVLAFAADELAFTPNQKLRVALREAALARLRAEGAQIAGHRYGRARRRTAAPLRAPAPVGCARRSSPARRPTR